MKSKHVESVFFLPSPSFSAYSFLSCLISLCTLWQGVQSAIQNESQQMVTTQECLDTAKSILGRNSPEFVLIPDNSGYNNFITTSVKVNVDWSHVHMLLDKSCIQSYLLEYRQFDYYGETQSNANRRRVSKRETSSNDARISPPIPTGETNYVISLPDDCQVYSVNLVVVPKSGAGGHLLYSKSRRFWPAAHRTTVESFSDGIVLSWPPICTHMTKEWRLETCAVSQDDCDVQNLQGDSPLHISKLKPCHSFQLRLLASTDDAGTSSGDILWTFNNVKTLPKPTFDLKAGHDSLKLRIQQLGCQPGIHVDHWRITHCQHIPHQKKSLYGSKPDDSAVDEYTLDLDESDRDGSGDGRGDDEEYYYYDNNEVNACVNSQHQVTESDIVKLENLDKCTLYSIDITPTDMHGETLQPGEQYGTIHSTLCGEQDNDDNFWFKEDKRGKESRPLPDLDT